MAFLTYKEILELIDKVTTSGIRSIEVESAGTRIRIEGAGGGASGGDRMAEASPSETRNATLAAKPAEEMPAAASATPAGDEIDASWHIVTSPIVGTFYSAANPEAEPIVRVGDRVSKGSVMCIVEAMKLMNEIESDADGEVVRVFPKNAQPIEYGERLFALRP